MLWLAIYTLYLAPPWIWVPFGVPIDLTSAVLIFRGVKGLRRAKFYCCAR